ncbi:MAG TPA: helix-turn-helix transcriptional regulator [Gaiellaceae bacterium]|nr:helix-turn-helix transcriptional regulator [Gaiellaceae bacterium]
MGELDDPAICLVVNVALGLSYPEEDLWAAMAVLWEDRWPQPEYLTGEVIHDAHLGKTRLRTLRESAGRTQEEMADALAITERAYRTIENDEQDSPRLWHLVRAANFLGVSLHEVCEERWLLWTKFPKGGADGPGDLDAMRAAGVTLLPPEWA